MSLKSVQTYEIDANGILKPVLGLVFATDTTGTVVLGGKCNNVQINSYVLDRNFSDNRYEYGPQLHFEANGSKPNGDSPSTPQYGTSAAITAGVNNSIVNGQASFIGAGQENLISGETRAVYVRYAQLINNQVVGTNYETHNSFGSKSFIGAGSANKIFSPKSAIIGGHGNVICGSNNFPSWELAAQTLPGVEEFTAYAPLYFQYDDDDLMRPQRVINAPGYNVIAGGKNNYLNNIYSVIGGGVCNGMFSDRCTRNPPVGGAAPYPSELSGQYNFIGGGLCNNLYNSKTSVIAGGTRNSVSESNNSSIAGGCRNLISGGGGSNNTLAGGFWNSILGGNFQFMGGGYRNTISGASFSALIGGYQNSIISNTIYGRDQDALNIIVGGINNTISGCLNSILGGGLNFIQGDFNAILAGSQNTIRNVSSATILDGCNTSAIHDGSSIIGDKTDRYKPSASKDALTLDFVSGTYIKNKIIFQNDNDVPLNHTSFGISGQISYDKNYLYRHNGDYWTKVAMATGDNQTIIGTKNFTTTPRVSGIAVAISNNVVDLSSNQNINGTKTFIAAPMFGGNPLITGNLSFYATTGNLENRINSLSGTLTGNYVTKSSGQFTNRPTVNGTGVLLSGEAANLTLPNTIVYTTGNQNISGIKAFISRPTVNGTGVLLSGEAVTIPISMNGSQQGKVSSLNFAGAPISVSIAGTTATINVASPSVQNGVYTTGNQTISGVKTFTTGIFAPNLIYNTGNQTIGGVKTFATEIFAPNLVYNTGDQTISGVKNFFTRPTINNSGVLLFGEASPSPIAIFGNGSSQGNAASLNFAGAGISVNTVGAQATITVGGGTSTQTTTIPTSSNSAGVSGAFAISDDYFYFCKRPNTWVRTALSNW